MVATGIVLNRLEGAKERGGTGTGKEQGAAAPVPPFPGFAAAALAGVAALWRAATALPGCAAALGDDWAAWSSG